MSEPFSNREIIRMHKELSDQLTTMAETASKERAQIWEQVKSTNSRVTKLEQWKWMITGAVAVLTTLVLPILFIVIRNWIQ